MKHHYERPNGETAYVTVRRGSLNLTAGAEESVLTCDGEGRPWTIWRAGVTVRRGYTGAAIRVRKEGGRRRREELSREQWREIWEPIRATLNDDLQLDLPQEARQLLDKAAQLTPERLDEDAAAFASVYGRIGIIPPDAYLALPLQLETGCPYGRCHFCDFYEDRPFHLRNLENFDQHIDAVIDYFGDALPMRRGVFLADANALVAPDDLLFSALETIQRRLPGERVTSFAGPGMERGRGDETYRRLRDLGLTRIHFGIESGSQRVLHLLGKPATNAWWQDEATAMIAAGISLGLIILVGAGGERLGLDHVEETVRVIEQLSLGGNDIIYLSPLITEPGRGYHRRLLDANSRPLDTLEIESELETFRTLFEGLKKPKPRVVRYDIRDFLS